MSVERNRPHIVKMHLLRLVLFYGGRDFELLLTFICGFDHSEKQYILSPFGKVTLSTHYPASCYILFCLLFQLLHLSWSNV